MGLKAVGPGFADTITAATAFLMPDGSVTVPSVGFSSDNDGTGTGFYRGAANQIYITTNGVYSGRFSGGFIQAGSGGGIGFENGAPGTLDAYMSRAGANSIRWNGASSGTTTTRTELNKAVATITNAAATDVLTVTIPNAAHSASLLVRVTGSLGAGGAIGANEATATNSYIIAITRTAGVATVATATAAFGAVAVAVAGAATVTATATVTAMTGAVGATQTFTVQITITRSTGSSDNHTCLVYAQLMNANVTGITMA